jgi:hypothetical protein
MGPLKEVMRKEVIQVNDLIREMGRTARDALQSWPALVRLIVLIAVCLSAAAIWHYLRL